MVEVNQKPSNKNFTDQEAGEVLKIIKRSNYNVVDQLHQTPTKIFILSLLINSEARRDSLMKVLSSAHGAEEITVNQFDNVVENLTYGSYLGFNDSELPLQGRAHNKKLHISIQIGTTSLSRVLTDTGSALNVLPKYSQMKLTLDGVVIRPISRIVKAFDDSQSIVFREVDLPVKICPHVFYITLHQKLKFFVEEKLVIIG